ncbi:BTAD domain-containing putative transcriptional regulator [Nonomuraea sp. NPDC046570]|uniref:AfsR/SARP family transcriptional regulator n=1 Tax=Nonomuraea sp. NPDC046570 TaxID=3155255 RepID=UPI0033C384E0
MEINLLGHLEVRHGERVVPVQVPRHRTVLATLALAAGRAVSVGQLLEALAGPREISSGVVRVYLSDLRKILPRDLIESVPGGRGYRLRVEPGQVDVERFRALLARRDGNAAARVRVLRAALDLWRGDALEDVESDHLQRMEAVPLEELRAEALEELCELRIGLGEHQRVLTELRIFVARHPLRDSAYRLLLIALYRSGNLGEALALYDRLRRVMAEELGTEPSARLRLLHERILRQDPALGADDRPPPAELPRDDPDFTGRARLLDRLDTAFATRPGGAPLPIVLYGHAGVGKSTLAVHTAWRHRERFPDGQLFADLRGEPDPGPVLARFLRSLAFPGGAIPASMAERLAAYRTLTAGRTLLVLLDNVSGEEQARPLLPTGPNSVALITGRSPLAGLAGARPYEVDVFTRDEARSLLARLGGTGRVETDGAATDRVIDACAGLPLAVRVVGSRFAASRDVSTAGLARRLRDEPSRLDEMRAGDVAVRTPLELGYESLDDELKSVLRLLARLSATDFAAWAGLGPAGWAEAVAGLGLLQRLAGDAAGQDRFRLHELMRLLVQERPGPREGLDRLADVALARVRAAVLPLTSEEFDLSGGPSMDTTDVRDGVEWLDAERAFLVALVADLAGRPDQAWRLAHALTPFFEARLYLDEWRTANRYARAAALEAGDGRGHALVLRDLGDLKRARHDLAGAVETYQESMGRFIRHGEPQDRAWVLLRLGLVHLERGEQAVAERMLAHGRTEFRAGGNRRGEARCLRGLGALRHRAGDEEVARDCLMSALTALRDLGDRHAQAACLHDLVTVRLARGEVAAARRHAEEEHDLAGRRLRDPRLTAYGLLSLALVRHAEGDPAAGADAGTAAARLCTLGDRHGHAWALAAVGELTGQHDELELARSIFAELGDVHGQKRVLRLLNRS